MDKLKEFTITWTSTSRYVKGGAGGRISVVACTEEIAKFQARKEVLEKEIGWMLEILEKRGMDKSNITIDLTIERVRDIE